MSGRAVEIDDRETIVTGATIAALVLAVVYQVSRLGFASHTADVLRATGFSLFLLSAPYWGWRALRRERSDFEWNRSQPFLTLALTAVTAVAAQVAGSFATHIGTACAAAGAAGAALVVFSWLKNGSLRSRATFSLGAIVLSGWAAGVVWSSRYKMPLYWEIFSTTADLHHDPLYVAAMGNMIRTYGVASTGLDGVPYTPYHYGSAWLFSTWADLLDTELLSFYSLGYAVVMIPLFLASLGVLATAARRSSAIGRAEGWLRSNWWGWLALLIATIGVIPDTGLYAMAVWNAHVFISESYLAGLPVFLLVLATALSAWRAERLGPVFLFLFLPVSIAALGFLKISLMALLFALLAYAVLRLPGRRLSWIVSLGLMGVAGYLTYSVVAVSSHSTGLSPLHFMRWSTPHEWHQFFPVIHFLWTWIYVAGRLYEERLSSVELLVRAARDRRILDVELLLVLALLGFLPGAVLRIQGGSAIYFSDVQRWVAIALVIARAGHWMALWRRGRATKPVERRSLRLMPIGVAFAAAPFILTMAMNAIRPLRTLAQKNVEFRATLVVEAGTPVSSGSRDRSLLRDPALLARGLARSEYASLIASLRETGRMPSATRRATLLFIPQSYEQFWRIFDRDDRCTYVGLIVPAVASIAMLDGMPYAGCTVTRDYNMQAYQSRQAEQKPADVADDSLCRRAAAKGFSRILVLEADSPGRPASREIYCGASARRA